MAQQQKPGRPSDKKPDEWQRDLNPDPMAGQNYGVQDINPDKAGPNADAIKQLHRRLVGYTDDELKQIPVVPDGSRLKQGATYIDLMDPQCQEFTAMGDMVAGPNTWYVPKSEVSYQLWNRLIGVENPERTGEGNQ
uniref:Uncharacterized protein n=1 Tax=Cyanothece sp. (strain PCC 7425 / ATCC 29141) TaxID=395961 RepID=B8HQX8_CYAP4